MWWKELKPGVTQCWINYSFKFFFFFFFFPEERRRVFSGLLAICESNSLLPLLLLQVFDN